MTEFITRNYGGKEFEVIIKTDNKEHYKATEDFARRLIDHAKPMSNADRIRAMSDEELAKLLVDHEYQVTKEVTATLGIGFEWEAHEKELSIKEILERLQQPAEEG